MQITKKLITLLTIATLLGGVFAYSISETRAASAIFYFTKEFVIKPLVRKLANALENKLVNKMNGLVSGVAQGVPSFILNWRNYTLDSAGRGNDVFRSVLADSHLCPYFDKNLKFAFGADKFIGAISNATVKNSAGQVVYQNKTHPPGLPSFQQLSGCSLPSNFNVGGFQNNFSGGWDTWNQVLQPQNNFFGGISKAFDEQINQMSTEAQSARDYSVAGSGFLGQKLGVGDSANPTGPTGCTKKDVGNRFATTSITRCMFMGKEVTNPKIMELAANNSLDKKLGRVGGGMELTDVLLNLVSSVMGGLTDRLANFIGQNTYDRPPKTSSFEEVGIPSTDPNAGNPHDLCIKGCDGELKDCQSKVSQECVTEPLTGQQTCTANPGEEAACQANRSSCVAQCP